ncbi:uncharacterized protein LOC124275864 [Haliotis rubra]|uniref:uncharacterized protein LOC124275864 n=1 Tax=Haliotis rubra TaxID=36100 RepID=UPI001EE5ACEB|nr:uncharacterized protein LOC124275864 [Haliotis rubra]
MSSGLRIGHGIVSGLSIISGLSMVLIIYFLNELIERANYEAREHKVTPYSFNGYAPYAAADSPVYIVGVVYIICGVIGVIATFINGKTFYKVEVIVCVVTLLIMAGILIVSMMVIGAFSPINMSFCQSFGRSCVCSQIIPNNWHFPCEELNTLYDMAVGIVAMNILGLVCTLAAAVISGLGGFGKKEAAESSDMPMRSRDRTNKI